jgi:Tfp pilus assembly protein PilN
VLQVLEDRVRLAAAGGMTEVCGDLRGGGGREFVNALFKEMEAFLVQRSLRGPRVVVALSRSLLVWRTFRVPPVPKETLDALIEFEVEKHLPSPREEMVFSCLPLGQTPEGWTILLAAARRDLLGFIEEALGMMGLKAAAVVPDLWGLVTLLGSRGARLDEGRTVVAHLDGAALETAIFSGDIPVVWQRHRSEVPPGEGDAAGLLRERAAGNARLIADDLEAAGSDPRPGEGFLLVEGTGADLLSGALPAAPVRGWRTFRTDDFAPLLGSPPEGSRRLLPLAGLALAADPAAGCPVDLLPRPAKKAPRKADWRLTVVRALILVLAGGALAGGVFAARRNRLRAVEREIAALKGRVTAVMALADQVKREEERQKALSGLVTKRVLFINILKELTVAIPKTAYLSQATLKGRTVELLGFADSASDLIPKLEASSLFKNVAFDGPITSPQGQQKERFKIRMVLE